MDDQTLFTVAYLGTFTGAVVAVRYVVEYTKDHVRDWTQDKLPIYIYALLWSWVVLFGAHALLGMLGGGAWFADFFSGFLVAGAAGAMQKPKAPSAPQG